MTVAEEVAVVEALLVVNSRPAAVGVVDLLHIHSGMLRKPKSSQRWQSLLNYELRIDHQVDVWGVSGWSWETTSTERSIRLKRPLSTLPGASS